jgi:ribosome-binding factor A
MHKEVKKDTNRIAKVNSLIQHELGPILHEFLYEEKGLVTITKVETSKDMKWAKVWISIFNPTVKETIYQTDKRKKPMLPQDARILKFLSDNIYDIQGEMNKHFFTKVIPKISFHLDTTPRYAQHIEEVIRKVHEEE